MCSSDLEVVPDMDILRGVPALLRGVSCEPLLGDLGHLDLSGFGWLVDGGESGPVARPADHEWFHSLRRQALDAGIPYFHKQNGGNRKVNGAWGGRELEGSTWGGVPELLPLALEHQARALKNQELRGCAGLRRCRWKGDRWLRSSLWKVPRRNSRVPTA